jgi:ribosomal protein L40E
MKRALDHVCPRCGGDVPSTAHKGQYPGAVSRWDDKTEICSPCGAEEALMQMAFGIKALAPDHPEHPWKHRP